MNKIVQKALTFDDVLIVPKESDIESRDSVDISTMLGPLKLDIPIISAPMDSVTEHELAVEMLYYGAGAIIHRYNTSEEQYGELRTTVEDLQRKPEVDRNGNIKYHENINFVFGFTLGIKNVDEQIDRFHKNLEACGRYLANKILVIIDIAHGHHKKVYELASKIKRELPHIALCAGNICTLDAAKAYKDCGIDIAKIGVGPGATCNTRGTTGCGYPQLSALLEIAWRSELSIIADGGMKNSGDIVKALAAGADAVMIGSLLAGCPESCAQQVQNEKGNKFKIYRGMASYSAKKDHQINDKYVEGESVFKPIGEPVKNVLDKLSAGIRSGCSYIGAHNLGELQAKAEFVEVSSGTQIENSVRTR